MSVTAPQVEGQSTRGAGATTASELPAQQSGACEQDCSLNDVHMLRMADCLHFLRGRLLRGPNPLMNLAAAQLPAALGTRARGLHAQLDWLLDELSPAAVRHERLQRELAEREAEVQATWATLAARQLYVGSAQPPARWTHLGWRQPDGRPVAVSREGGEVFFVAGAIGSGKSQTMLSLLDGALLPQPGLSSATLPPTAAVAFHSDLTGVSLPELCSAVFPNQRAAETRFLWEHLRATPRGLPRVRMLVPEAQMDEVCGRVRQELGDVVAEGLLEILPLRLRLGDLGARGLEALLGVGPGETPRYMRELLRVAADQGADLTVEELRRRLEQADGWNAQSRALALERLTLLDALEGREEGLWDLVDPGALTIINLSGAWLRRQHALPTLLALLNGLAQPSPRHGPLQRLFLVDEVNRLEGEVAAWMHLVMLLRQIRYSGSSIALSGQDFMNTPNETLGQGTQFLCFRVTNPKVLQHLQQRVAGFAGLRAQTLAALHPGHALWVPTECSDPGWRGEAQQVYIRPARCQHGGHTVAVL